MTQATSGFGTLLQIGDGGGPENFTSIAEVRNVSGPELTLDTAEATHHTSPGGWDEHIATLLRGGEVTASLNFLPADATQSFAAGLLKDMTDKTLRNFKVIFPDPGTTEWDFAAYVTAFSPTAPIDDVLTADITLMISGQPTLA